MEADTVIHVDARGKRCTPAVLACDIHDGLASMNERIHRLQRRQRSSDDFVLSNRCYQWIGTMQREHLRDAPALERLRHGTSATRCPTSPTPRRFHGVPWLPPIRMGARVNLTAVLVDRLDRIGRFEEDKFGLKSYQKMNSCVDLCIAATCMSISERYRA